MLEQGPLEVPETLGVGTIVGPELHLQSLPRNEDPLPEVAHPIGQPAVDINGHGRALKGSQDTLVNGDRAGNNFVEEIPPQGDEKVCVSKVRRDKCRNFERKE